MRLQNQFLKKYLLQTDEFCSRMKEKGLDQAVSTEKVKMKKSSGVQEKIKTDTDVEVLCPDRIYE